MKKHKMAKGMKGKMMGKGHTGPITHKGMGSYIDGMGGKDPIADPMHHQANMAHGMPEGMSPKGGYDGGEEGMEQGGEGMSDNCTNC